MGGVLRGSLAVLVYFITLLFYGGRFLFFAILPGVLFGGIMYLISRHYTTQGTVTRGLLDAITVFFPLFIAFGIVREKIRSMGRTAGTHGTARFASRLEIWWLTQAKAGPLLGRDLQSRKLLRYDGDGHLMTIAPTRTGKGVGTVIPNLLSLNRAVICVDPKGENAGVSPGARYPEDTVQNPPILARPARSGCHGPKNAHSASLIRP